MIRGTCLALALTVAPALAEERYVGVFIGSQHIGSDAYNDFNPGLAYGRRFAIGEGTAEWHVEGGVFYNSYREVSPIFVAGLSTGVAQIGRGEVRVGASIGTAYYRELADILDRRNGLPNIGGFLPIGVLTAAYRTERIEYRLNVIPYGDDIDGVVNLSLAIPF
ncbi:MAG: hypothetical protein WBA67_07790 [Jannaschia sp.]